LRPSEELSLKRRKDLLVESAMKAERSSGIVADSLLGGMERCLQFRIMPGVGGRRDDLTRKPGGMYFYYKFLPGWG
jgi:hypothetical protein